MTLTISIVSRNAIFQSVDFRLTDLRTGAFRDFKTHKQIEVSTSDHTSLVSFHGVGHTGRIDVAKWLYRELADHWVNDGDLADLLGRLTSFSGHLRHIQQEARFHTFTVAGFSAVRPHLVVVSNFESLSGRPLEIPGPELEATFARPSSPRLIVGGSGAAHVSSDERATLIGLVRSGAPQLEVETVLRETHLRIAGVEQTVSPSCRISSRTVVGGGRTELVGVPDSVEYREPVVMGIDIESIIGRSGSVRLIGSGSYPLGKEHFHIRRLKLFPNNAEYLNAYGHFLHDRGRLVEAREMFSMAVEADSSNAAHLNNLSVAVRPVDEQASRALLQRALQVDPESAHAIYNYARQLQAEGRTDEALRLVRGRPPASGHEAELMTLAEAALVEGKPFSPPFALHGYVTLG